MKRALATMCALALFGQACGGDDGASVEQDVPNSLSIVNPGKADNYYSNVSLEYEASGSVIVAMSEATAKDPTLRRRAILSRLSAIGVYLTTYMTDKFEGLDLNNNGRIDPDEVFFNNAGYGGFKAMVRNQTLEEMVLEELEPGQWRVNFTMDLAGPPEMAQLLEADGAALADDGSISFGLKLPKGATTDPESPSSRPIRSFDPDKYQGELETVELKLKPHPAISDAYPQYKAYMEDGIYEITMFFGYDYNDPRVDLKEAQETFEHLVALGFKPPVDSYEQLNSDSGPFTGAINIQGPAGNACIERAVLGRANAHQVDEAALAALGLRTDAVREVLRYRQGEDGQWGTLDDRRFHDFKSLDDVKGIGPSTLDKARASVAPECQAGVKAPITVEVRIFHADMFTSDRRLQHDLAIYELQQRDIFFYNGHAGPYYGFYLDAADEAAVSYEEFKSVALDPKRQQLFVAQGCQTYSQYADMLYANPSKSEDNLDVITTVNYSYGQGTLQLFNQLIMSDQDGTHYPISFYDIISALNNDPTNDHYGVFYGVMGIDGNPQLNPYADVDLIGQACQSQEDCVGNPNANLCVGYSDGGSYCIARTLGEAGCPEGSTYAYVSSEQTVLGGVCYK